MEKLKVAYMGYSDKMIEYILENDNFQLCKLVGGKNRISDKYYTYIRELNIPYIEIDSKEALEGLYDFFKEVDAVLVYEFEYILPQQMVNQYKIFNFHGGNLRTNRGAHPVVWSILNMEKETCLSAYQLTGGIDEGVLLGEYRVNIDENDTTGSLADKLRKGIPVLLNSVMDYLDGKKPGVLVRGGIYRRRVTEQDYTIDLANDTIEIMASKIRSQVGYSGAICFIDGKKERIKKYCISDCEEKETSEKKITIVRNDKCITLYIEEPEAFR